MTKIEVNFNLCNIYYELKAFEQYHDIFEANLYKIKIKKRRTDFNFIFNDIDEVDMKNVECDDFCERILPRHFRNQLLVTLWSILEQSLCDVSKCVREKLPHLKLQELQKRQGFLKNVQEFYTQLLGHEFFTKSDRYKNLRLISRIRNIIVHANGNFDSISRDDRVWLNKVINSDPDLEYNFGVLIIHEGFLRKTYSFIREFLEELLNELASKYDLHSLRII